MIIVIFFGSYVNIAPQIRLHCLCFECGQLIVEICWAGEWIVATRNTTKGIVISDRVRKPENGKRLKIASMNKHFL